MRLNNDYDIEIVLKLLKSFLDGHIVDLHLKYVKKPKILHYYNEIVRFWSSLNYIVNKSMRSLKVSEDINNNDKAILLFLSYRFFFERAYCESIFKELNLSDNKRSFHIDFYQRLKSFSWDKALIGKSKLEIISIKESIPSFMIENLSPYMNFDFLEQNLIFMNYLKNQKYVSLRINTLKKQGLNGDLDRQIIDDLRKEGINLSEDAEISKLYYIPLYQKSLILQTKWYQEGYIILQDKGSAAIIKVLAPEPYESIFDMCAAPGIKASLIAQYTNNKSRIIAGDFDYERLSQANFILRKLNIKNTHLINFDSIKAPNNLKNKFDRVLLDAPCTGSGTLLSNPGLKWRQGEKFLYQNMTLQEKLIESALDLLKLGGIFVYSTCSLYSEEGESQILKYLNKLDPLELPKWFSPSYRIKDEIIPGTGRLFPTIHNTQGFFVGKFKKKAI